MKHNPCFQHRRKAATAAAVSALASVGAPGSAEALFGRGKSPEMLSAPAIERRLEDPAGEVAEAAEDVASVRLSWSAVVLVSSFAPYRFCVVVVGGDRGVGVFVVSSASGWLRRIRRDCFP